MSLPRQSTVDQLKRIRDEINKYQDVQVGPEHQTMKGDVGDRVIEDLVSHKNKQEMNNLFWWDNPLDRHICSYEDWVKKDSRDSLGYTPDGDPGNHKATDIPNRPESEVPKKKSSLSNNNITGKNILENMKHIMKYDELLNEGIGFGRGFIKKALEFINKIEDLFTEIVISENDINEFLGSNRLNLAIVKNPGYYKQIKNIYNENKERIDRAYDEVFGLKEEFLTGILISIAVCFFIYYAIQKGWADKVIRKFDPNFRGQGGYPNEEWKTAKPKKIKKEPRKIQRNKQQEIDVILDKMSEVGYDGLSPSEKEILKRNR